MRSYNDNYLAKFEAETKKKRFTVRVDFAEDNSDPVYLTSHSDAATPPGATVISSVIKNCDEVSQELGIISSIGSTQIEAVDVGDSLTSLFRAKYNANKGLRTKRVQLYDGYTGLAWDDYEIQSTYAVGKLIYRDSLYTIIAEDVQRIAKDAFIFDTKETRLRATLSESETARVYVYENDIELNPHGVSYSDAPNTDVFYIKINSEIIRCDGAGTDGTYGKYYSIHTGGRGALNTVAAEHSVDSGGGESKQVKVEEYIYVEMPVIKLIYAILLGALYGQTGKTFPYSIGMDTEYLANDDFIANDALLDLYDPSDDTAGTIYYREGLTKTNAKQFIEQSLLPLISCHMPVYATGEWGLRRRVAIKSSAAPVAVFDDSNIISYSDVSFDYDAVRNNILVHWHYNGVLKENIRHNRFIFSQSVARNKTTAQHEITLDGLHGSRHTLTTLAGIIQRLVDSIVEPPITCDIDVLPRESRPENGDVITLNTRRIKDYTGSGAYINRAFEIIGKSANRVSGKTNYKLRGASGETEILDIEQQAANVLPDALFQNGTEIDSTSFPGRYTNVGGVGHLGSGALTLTGGATMSAGEYWHDGDITFDSDCIPAGTNNVRVWCTGHITINCKIDMKARGITGGTGNGTQDAYGQWSQWYGNPAAVEGALGGSIAGQGGSRELAWYHPKGGIVSVGRLGPSIPIFNIYYDGTNLVGLPEDLRGIGGPAGTKAAYKASLTGEYFDLGAGGDGGDGGGGITFICRGLSFGAGGSVDTSGGDASAGEFSDDILIQAGAGGVGCPGGVLVVIDGNGVIPDLADNVTALNGEAAVQKDYHPFKRSDVSGSLYDFTNSVTRVQLVPKNEAPEDEQAVFKPSPVSGLALASNFTKNNKDGSVVAQINATWTPSTDPLVDHYQMQIKLDGAADSTYRDIGRRPDRTDASLLFTPDEFIEGQAVIVRMRSVNIWRSYGNWITSGSGHTIIGKDANPSAPTGLSVAAIEGGVKLTWTNATDADLLETRIYQAATNNRPGSPAVSVGVANIGSVQSHELYLTPGTLNYFWVDHKDTTGHTSSATYPASSTAGVSGTAGKYKYVSGTDIDDLAPSEAGSDVTGANYNFTWSDDLIIDGDMELNNTDYWTTDLSSYGVAKSEAEAYYGTRSLMLTVAAPLSRSKAYNIKKAAGETGYNIGFKIPLQEAFDSVFATVWAKNSATGSAKLFVEWFDGSKAYLSESQVGATVTGTAWTQISGTVAPPSGARYFSVYLYTGTSGVNAYFDALSAYRRLT